MSEQDSIGMRIRLFFRDLLGSRLAARLEDDLLRLRLDMEERLQDKERTIATLREEKQLMASKLTTYELTIMPHSSRMGAEVVAYSKPAKPNFSFTNIDPPKSRWQVMQAEHEQQLAKEIEAEKSAAQPA